jgi:hypothetical protein
MNAANSVIIPYRATPEIQIQDRRGEVCTITSGELPAFPEWFVKELAGMVDRLQKESAKVEIHAM